MFLVGELSKFPLLYNSWESELTFPGVFPFCAGSRTLGPPGSRRKNWLRGATRQSAIAWGAGYTSTYIQARAPASSHRWPPPLISAYGGARLPKRSQPSPATQSKLNCRDLKLPELNWLTLHVPNRGRRGLAWGAEVWLLSLANVFFLRANLSRTVLVRQKVSPAAADCLNSPMLHQTSSHYP